MYILDATIHCVFFFQSINRRIKSIMLQSIDEWIYLAINYWDTVVRKSHVSIWFEWKVDKFLFHNRRGFFLVNTRGWLGKAGEHRAILSTLSDTPFTSNTPVHFVPAYWPRILGRENVIGTYAARINRSDTYGTLFAGCGPSYWIRMLSHGDYDRSRETIPEVESRYNMGVLVG